MSSISSSLLLRLRNNEQDAWDRLAAIFGPLVYGWVRKAGLQASDAMDVVQEVFRAVASNLNQFDHDGPGSTFRGWLWTITRNKVRDHARRLQNEPAASGGTDAQVQLQELPDEQPVPADNRNVELSRLSQRALEIVKAEFEATTWQAFWRSVVEGDAATDIAQDLGVTKWAVYKARTRVLARLREELGEIV